MWELLLIVAAAALIAGSLTDLRTREVPDWVNFAGIAAGLGLRAIESVSQTSWTPFLSGLIAFGIAWALGASLFYLGQWGGGDSKMLMALGALFGIEWNPFSFSISFIINLLVVGGFYGLFWMMFLGIKHFKKARKAYAQVEKQNQVKLAKVVAHISAMIALVIALLIKGSIYWMPVLLGAPLVLFTYYLFVCLRSVEQVCFLNFIPVNALVEGDWIVKDIKVRGEYICGKRDLGISQEQIKLLQKHGVKKVLVKSGIPFIPSFFLAFVVTLCVGNLMFAVLL